MPVFGFFWRESFEASKQRLAARGSGSQARKIASPVKSHFVSLTESIPILEVDMKTRSSSMWASK